MRYVGLVIFLISIPTLIALIRSKQVKLEWLAILLGASAFIQGWSHLYVSVLPWSHWPGYAKGLLVTLPDVLSIAIIATTPRVRHRTPLLMLLWGYVAAASVAILFANVKMAAFFYTWQLLRAALVGVAAARLSVRPDGPRLIVYGLGFGIAFQAFFSLWQRLEGVNQTSGTMGHQNLLGMMTHFAFLLSLGLVLAGDKRRMPMIACLGAVTVLALSGSRATMVLGLAGAGLLLVLSTFLRPTPRKYGVLGLAAVVALAAVPVGYSTFKARPGVAEAQSLDGEREAFERAAKAMWADHPMGVGANSYVITANSGGYSERAGVNWNATSRAANVHNVYLLMGAETGFLGLGAFLLLVGTALLVAGRMAWNRARWPYNDLALATFVVLVVVTAHNFYEWVFITEPVENLFATLIGIVAGLKVQEAAAASARRAQLLARRQQAQESAGMPEAVATM